MFLHITVEGYNRWINARENWIDWTWGLTYPSPRETLPRCSSLLLRLVSSFLLVILLTCNRVRGPYDIVQEICDMRKRFEVKKKEMLPETVVAPDMPKDTLQENPRLEDVSEGCQKQTAQVCSYFDQSPSDTLSFFAAGHIL